MFLWAITDTGAGGGRGTVSAIPSICKAVVIATVVKEIQMRWQKGCSYNLKQNWSLYIRGNGVHVRCLSCTYKLVISQLLIF